MLDNGLDLLARSSRFRLEVTILLHPVQALTSPRSEQAHRDEVDCRVPARMPTDSEITFCCQSVGDVPYRATVRCGRSRAAPRRGGDACDLVPTANCSAPAGQTGKRIAGAGMDVKAAPGQ